MSKRTEEIRKSLTEASAYVVATWDGTTGNSRSFETLQEAQKAFEEEKEYYTSRGYKLEWIELYAEDGSGNVLEAIETFAP